MEKPNIILITIDSLRADHLGCYGYSRPTSPNIDALAGESILFLNAFSNGPNTPHAFPAIMASRYPLMSNRLGVFDAPITLAEVLNKNGYHTYGLNAGNPYLSRYFKYDRGFEVFFDYIDFEIPDFRSVSINERQLISIPKLDIHFYNISFESIERKLFLEKLIFRDIENLLDNITPPFFLWLHFMDTHYPYVPQKKYLKNLGVDLQDIDELTQLNKEIREDNYVSERKLKKIIALYDASILQIDQRIGEITNKLKKLNLINNSILIITADHGEEFQEHGNLQHKSKLFDELLHVPLIIKLPNSSSKFICYQIVDLIRLAPTIISFISADNPFRFDGLLLFNKESPNYVISESSYVHNHSIPVSEQMFNIDTLFKIYSVRSKNYKMIGDYGKNKYFLYNLINDPSETCNIFKQNTPVAKIYKTILENHVKKENTYRLKNKIKNLKKPIFNTTIKN